jgi:hypothetical protein
MRKEAVKGSNSQKPETGLSAQSTSLERSNWFGSRFDFNIIW